jgi:hypothetical protein
MAPINPEETARDYLASHHFTPIVKPDRLLGEPITPPPLAPRARAPPEFDLADDAATLPFDQSSRWDLSAPPPDPDYGFNQQADV